MLNRLDRESRAWGGMWLVGIIFFLVILAGRAFGQVVSPGAVVSAPPDWLQRNIWIVPLVTSILQCVAGHVAGTFSGETADSWQLTLLAKRLIVAVCTGGVLALAAMGLTGGIGGAQ